MSHVNDMDCREVEAFAWVVRLLPGNATTADLEEFRRWCSQSPAHAQAFAHAHRLWDEAQIAGRNVLERGTVPSALLQSASGRIGRRALLGGALAAAAATGYAVVRPPLDLWPPLHELLTADYRTSTGEQRTLTLAGNVLLEMNTRTSIALRLRQEGADRIELIAGESVVTTKGHAFEVVAGETRAAASNATFNVRNDYARVCVTCLSGEVTVACGESALSLGERQQVSCSGPVPGEVIGIDPTVVTAWQSGFLVFHDTPLSEVIAEANRYRQGKIILVNAALGHRLVNARFRLDRIDDIVPKLTDAFGATATSLPGGVVLLG
jgi:transmembrane sensor